jgi:uncharacterized membrane protein
MALLITGLIAFLGLHLLPGFPGYREKLVASLGQNGYRAAFSIASVATLALLIWGYAQAPFVEIWSPPTWTRHLAALFMAVALVALMAAFFPGRIRQRLKHPMLVAIKIWAFAHLLANGDLASMLLFGGFLAYAVVDRILVKKRGEGIAGLPGHPARNDAIAVIAGLGLYIAVVMWLHRIVIGVPVFA